MEGIERNDAPYVLKYLEEINKSKCKHQKESFDETVLCAAYKTIVQAGKPCLIYDLEESTGFREDILAKVIGFKEGE